MLVSPLLEATFQLRSAYVRDLSLQASHIERRVEAWSNLATAVRKWWHVRVAMVLGKR